MPLATMADAHREWHENTGRCCGCPYDACDPEYCPTCNPAPPRPVEPLPPERLVESEWPF